MATKSYRSHASSTDEDDSLSKVGLWRRFKPTYVKPKKVSGAELETKFDSWRDTTKKTLASRTPEQNNRMGRRVVCLSLLALIGVVAVGGSVITNENEQTIASHAHKISEQEKDLGVLVDGDPDEPVVDADSMLALTNSTVEIAELVADGQNTFAVLAEAESKAWGPGNGSMSAAAIALIEHRKDLAQYWAKGSFLVDDEQAYAHTPIPLYDTSTKIDPRFPWYLRYDAQVASPASSYSWTVESAMPSLTNPTTAGVIWTCTQTDGTVLAWASATYNDEAKTFSALNLVITATGVAHQLSVDYVDTNSYVPELGGQG